ncbi:uncharacterized protein LOC119985579 [Tripterygium wilfordii]|uniref:uncharacterized protein LOC119985579 n=1 Tax=Tripterygium wilfordii TaxID=458696 RepID=UPI0018F81D2D|nr:uncharacterized protein LOC119985579 [Tripterygium wilfordii]
MPRPSSIIHGIPSSTNQIDCNIPHEEDRLTIEAKPVLLLSDDELGTIDQSFYDCQAAWPNSDSEDDFYSARGDSISCASTSSRRSINKTCSLERNRKKKISLEQKPSPEKKERLVELLQDPFWSDLVASTDISDGGFESEATSLDQSSVHKSPALGIGGSQLDLHAIKKKRMTGTHCGCVPSLKEKKRSNLTRKARN